LEQSFIQIPLPNAGVLVWEQLQVFQTRVMFAQLLDKVEEPVVVLTRSEEHVEAQAEVQTPEVEGGKEGEKQGQGVDRHLPCYLELGDIELGIWASQMATELL